ncbi:amidohydrolase family protein [Streptomyces malaysiensis]|uniref:2-amino-3-carboxymuconate-6-semialdehyde decarboxylase n=1 Tax=Streptomyces malaysiensis TaxID=92644 RepID=A0A7X6B0D4_STRMQ|nr:amidohydrolase family protein [Streptomyces malaysiensis]NIY69414.1 2-amino-3-carboxymuconate-6-semialdehyde decarboxylase [Streptomyces malaysiensis]
MPLIDVHTHFFPTGLINELAWRYDTPCVEADGGITYVRYAGEKRFPLRPEMTDLDAKLSDMDRLGIDVSILSVTMPGVDGLGDDAARVARIANDQLTELTSAHPTRLGWVAVLPMDDPAAAGAELRRAVTAGARGAMIYSNVAGRPLDLDVDRPVFETACELDVPILLHPTLPLAAATLREFELISTLGYLFDTTTAALRLTLSGMFTRHPDLKFVVCHAGSLLPYQVGRIDHQAMNRPAGRGPITGAPSEDLLKLYTDSVCLSPPTLRYVVDFFGASKVMMGSDHPQWTMDGGVRTVRDTHLSNDERSLVESGTAATLFNWSFPEVSLS